MKISTLTLAGASALVLLAAAGAASAQIPGGGGGGPPTAQGANGGPIGRMTGDQQNWRFESEEARRRNMTPEEAEEVYGAERMDLARRVQDLMDQGLCREARELANAEGDRNMALRVRQTCRRRSN